MREESEQWRQVLARDAAARFVYAVSTTGVFCRASCPSRRPARAHVRFFPDAAEAREAGFRACLRCRPEGPGADAELAARVAAIVTAHLDRQVTLAELARSVGASAGTVQRAFTRVVGLSPRAYANAARAERFRAELAYGSVTDAVYAAGFSSPSRAGHNAPLGMAAKRFRAGGPGERIGYAIGPAPSGLGLALVGATERGVCAVLLGDDQGELAAELRRRFPLATIAEDPALARHCESVLSGTTAERELPLDLRGTAFQARVWASLRAIPRGETRSYAQVAASVGNPKAVRAVARACAQNPAAIVVPCHRVVGSDGSLTGYRWGIERKRALLALESAGSAAPVYAGQREEFRVKREPARAGERQRQERADVQDGQLAVVGGFAEELQVVDENPGHQQIGEDKQSRPPSRQA